ncbi:MAG: hypothetical protein ABS87_12455 [Sphingomonas sp. SCN 67-18]|uniref:cell division protein ZapA n=1 Tax=uncultured Sphingomonas sp. TaxID=158754 RepID=UPI00086C789C|nr:cell division protein ZapA [Sphingomonas sp. SCN 67-18]ODU19954.1 MAG: hypothetical protein ABS87_12455 [Sphingomonas sp. SCN 67-18]
MADVTLEIGGRSYSISCRDGEEDHLRALARLVDAKAENARAAVGGVNEARQLLLAALLLADELNDIRSGAAPATPLPVAEPTPDPAISLAIERLAERVERFADSLEAAARNA